VLWGPEHLERVGRERRRRETNIGRDAGLLHNSNVGTLLGWERKRIVGFHLLKREMGCGLYLFLRNKPKRWMRRWTRDTNVFGGDNLKIPEKRRRKTDKTCCWLYEAFNE
jgi:hypothetical protein